MADWMVEDPACPPGPPEVVQSGSDFALLPRECYDGAITLSGGGTVSGNTLSGQFETRDFIGGELWLETFTAVVNGNTIDLLESQIVLRGWDDGACDIVPALSLQITINP